MPKKTKLKLLLNKLKIFVLLTCFSSLCFATEHIDDLTKVSFEPLKENETLEWEYYDSGTSNDSVPYVANELLNNSVVIYKNKNGKSKEFIVAFECTEIKKINNTIYFCYDNDQTKNGYDKYLYASDGIAGRIVNLNIKLENNLPYVFCVSDDEKYICYAKVDSWNVSYSMLIPVIDLIKIRTGEKTRFDFKDTFLRSFHVVEYDDIRIMYMKNRFYIEFLESEVQANSFDGYIDLYDMQFYLTLGNPNGYKNQPLNLTNFVKTHITLDSLNLRRYPSTKYKTVIYTVSKGKHVQMLKAGKYNDTIDGITAPWVKVLTEDGHTGWCFSGYLEKSKNE